MGWNEEFEEECLNNRNRPIEVKDEAIFVDTTPSEAYEEERKRMLKEAKARREALS